MYCRFSVAFLVPILMLGFTPAWGQLVDIRFEDDGTETFVADDDLAGQGGFVLPVVGSENWVCYEYTDNLYEFPDHPDDGGEQFVAGRSIGTAFARAQLNDVDFVDATGWTCVFDIAVKFDGEFPATQNVGSFSTQNFAPEDDLAEATFIALATWDDLDTATTWSVNYVSFSAGDTQQTEAPDPAEDDKDFDFQGLAADTWYRWSTSFNLDSNRITRVAIEDIAGGDSYSFSPDDWYLDGGEDGGLDAPSGFRLFTGGTTAGNIVAIDNIIIFEDCDGDGIEDVSQIDDDPDCNDNGILDACDRDCDENGLVDDCEIVDDPSLDCDDSGSHDFCDLIDFPDEVDCDGNEQIDSCEIALDPDLDCNDNGVLDVCNDDLTPILFVRGDSTGDGFTDILDLFDSLGYQFTGDDALCIEAMDFDDNGLLNLTDIFGQAAFIFSDGPDPAAPYPGCGEDLDDDDLDCDAHCDCA